MSPGTAAKCHWQCLFLIDKVFFQGPYTDNWPFVTLLMHTAGGFGYCMHCDCLSTAVCSRRRPVHRLLQAKCPEPAERGSRGDGRSMSAQCLLNHQWALIHWTDLKIARKWIRFWLTQRSFLHTLQRIIKDKTQIRQDFASMSPSWKRKRTRHRCRYGEMVCFNEGTKEKRYRNRDFEKDQSLCVYSPSFGWLGRWKKQLGSMFTGALGLTELHPLIMTFFLKCRDRLNVVFYAGQTCDT